jgi:hypothetical protein
MNKGTVKLEDAMKQQQKLMWGGKKEVEHENEPLLLT